MYIVMTSNASMPRSVKATYRNVAVVEVEHGVTPKFIGDRARWVKRIVYHWGPQHVGSNPKGNTAFERAHRAAIAMAQRLNSLEIGAPVLFTAN